MKLLNDPSSDADLKVRIEGLDDLWYLHQLLDKDCIVGSHTYRKLEAKDDMVRSSDQPRIKVYLRIRVEESEFHPFTDALRIKGEVIEGPDDISGHHTINANPGSHLDIWKEPITEMDMQLLDEACASSGNVSVIAVSLDDENADVFRVRDYGAERIASVKAGQGGKMYKSADRWSDYYEKITGSLEHHLSDDSTVIITGPGFFKEKLSKTLSSKGLVDARRIHLLNSSSAGLSGLKESLSSGKGMADTIADIRFVRENQVMEELMTRIGKGTLSTYGITDVRRALEMGAVETLLVIDSLFRVPQGKELFEIASRMGTSSLIISSSHEMGEMLEKLGGAGALLRFEI